MNQSGCDGGFERSCSFRIAKRILILLFCSAFLSASGRCIGSSGRPDLMPEGPRVLIRMGEMPSDCRCTMFKISQLWEELLEGISTKEVNREVPGPGSSWTIQRLRISRRRSLKYRTYSQPGGSAGWQNVCVKAQRLGVKARSEN